jgi:hypothetical protein
MNEHGRRNDVLREYHGGEWRIFYFFFTLLFCLSVEPFALFPFGSVWIDGVSQVQQTKQLTSISKPLSSQSHYLSTLLCNHNQNGRPDGPPGMSCHVTLVGFFFFCFHWGYFFLFSFFFFQPFFGTVTACMHMEGQA